jgi:hypothetical protein
MGYKLGRCPVTGFTPTSDSLLPHPVTSNLKARKPTPSPPIAPFRIYQKLNTHPHRSLVSSFASHIRLPSDSIPSSTIFFARPPQRLLPLWWNLLHGGGPLLSVDLPSAPQPQPFLERKSDLCERLAVLPNDAQSTPQQCCLHPAPNVSFCDYKWSCCLVGGVAMWMFCT